MRTRLCALLLAPTLAYAIEPSIYQWRLAPSGDITVGDNGHLGTKLDVENDLGYGGAEPCLGFGVTFGFEHQIAVDLLQLDLSAGQKTKRDIRYSDLTFPSGTPVHSEMNGDLLRVAYRFVAGSDEMRMGFTLGLDILDVEAGLSSPSIGSADESIGTAMPVVGGVLESTPSEYYSFRASVAGGSWNWTDSSATVLEANADVRIHVEQFFAGVGYRYLRVEGENDNTPARLDVTLRGPVLFAGLYF